MKKSIALIFAATTLFRSYAQIGTNAPQAGDVPPRVQLGKMIQGPPIGEVTWEKLKGKLVVLEFWNTACRPCIEAIPHLNELADQFKSNQVVFLWVSDDNENHLNQFLKEHPVRAWVALDGPNNATEQAFHLQGYGLIVLINPAGKVVVISLPAFLEAKHLEEILAGKPCSLHPLKFVHPSSSPTAEWAKILAMRLWSLKELEAESAEMQPAMLSQLFSSLPRLGGGWCANKSLQATRDGALSSASRFTSFGPACLSSSRYAPADGLQVDVRSLSRFGDARDLDCSVGIDLQREKVGSAATLSSAMERVPFKVENVPL